ncbi:MAG: ABC transporter permease [Thermoplasmata archaeon]|nr:ABC transporter permease [Thermoplasmata archaeon]
MASALTTMGKIRPELPTDFGQMTRVTKYELLNFVRSARFIVLLAITLIISGALASVVAYYRPPAMIGSGFAFYSIWWAPAIAALIALSGTLFGGDAISGEFQSKTGYFLFAHPVRRSSVFLGKMAAAFLASTVIIGVFAVISLGNGWYYTGPPPIQFWESVGFALVYLLGVLGFTFLFSSLFKSAAMSIIVTLVLLLFGFTLIDALVSNLAHVEPWYSITYAGGIITNVLIVPYPPHTVVGGFSPYNASILEGVVILLIYAVLGAVGGYALFRQQDFT